MKEKNYLFVYLSFPCLFLLLYKGNMITDLSLSLSLSLSLYFKNSFYHLFCEQ